MAELYGSLGIIGIVILIIFIVLIPISIYSAQKYAYKCFKELQKINNKIDAIWGVHKKDQK